MSGPIHGTGRGSSSSTTNTIQRGSTAQTTGQGGGGGGGTAPQNSAPTAQQRPAGDAYETRRTNSFSGLNTLPSNATIMRRGMPDDRTIAQTFGQPVIPANRFMQELGSTPAQKEVLNTLQKDARFQALWGYFDKFPGGNPLRFASVPGLKMGGVERYGGYFPGQGTLAINPTKPEHVSNPQELADTIVHELAHAAFDVRERAKANGVKTPPWPLPEGAADLHHDDHFHGAARSTRRDSPLMLPHRDYMDGNYGPGASNPKEEWIDINHGTQQFIVDLVKDNIQKTGHGTPTITFDNLKQ